MHARRALGRRSPLDVAYTAPVVLAERSSSGSRAYKGGGIDPLAAPTAIAVDPQGPSCGQGGLALQVLSCASGGGQEEENDGDKVMLSVPI